jgi:hypothetical protein
VNDVKQFDRKELVLAVWAAEFTRALHARVIRELGDLSESHAALRWRLAESAAESADRTVETLRLYIEVEFRRVIVNDDRYMAWADFVDTCRDGGFTDDDGHGELADGDKHVSNVRVYPSTAVSANYVRPDWATHVCWFNK